MANCGDLEIGGLRAILEHLERDLKRLVFGQDKAIELLSSAMKLSRAGLRDPDKPIGSFLFSGPTGVGKTELCKALAGFMATWKAIDNE